MYTPSIEVCPFCFSNMVELHRDFDYVRCKSCGAQGHVFDGHPHDAVATWNSVSLHEQKIEKENQKELDKLVIDQNCPGTLARALGKSFNNRLTRQLKKFLLLRSPINMSKNKKSVCTSSSPIDKDLRKKFSKPLDVGINYEDIPSYIPIPQDMESRSSCAISFEQASLFFRFRALKVYCVLPETMEVKLAVSLDEAAAIYGVK